MCPTEIIAFSDRAKEFEALGCQLLACSTDTEESHLAWIKTPRSKCAPAVLPACLSISIGVPPWLCRHGCTDMVVFAASAACFSPQP